MISFDIPRLVSQKEQYSEKISGQGWRELYDLRLLLEKQ